MRVITAMCLIMLSWVVLELIGFYDKFALYSAVWWIATVVIGILSNVISHKIHD